MIKFKGNYGQLNMNAVIGVTVIFQFDHYADCVGSRIQVINLKVKLVEMITLSNLITYIRSSSSNLS